MLRPHRRYVWIAITLMAISTPLSLISPFILKHITDSALEDVAETGAADWNRISGFLFILIGMTLLSVVLGVFTGYCTTLFHTKALRDVRDRLYVKMQGFSISYHAQKETGYLISRQIDDVGNLNGVMADTFGRTVIELARGIGCVFALFLIQWQLALGGLVLIVVIFGFELLMSPRHRRLSRFAREKWSRSTEALHQSVSGHALVQSTASEKREAKRFLGTLHESVRAGLKRDLFSLWTHHVLSLIVGVAPTIIIVGGVYLTVQGEFSFGGLLAFFMFLMQLTGSVHTVATFNPGLQNSLASLERIFEVLDTEPEISSPPGALRVSELAGAVHFDDVTFAYIDGSFVLDHVTFEIPPRRRVAVVGPSGAGKTTLVHMIPRFLDPSSGIVRVDEHDVRTLDLRLFRRNIGFVPQEVFLFDRTVAENISHGRPDATMAEIAAAASAANAAEFIEEMQDGYETAIGERGVRLSGGQRQRIAIAREILRDPSILILDEATSSLDSESEALIQEAMETLLAGRTSFVIAHRLSTVLAADEILVLDKGRMVARGPHAELVAQDGLYARLFYSQFKRPLGEV